MIAKGVPLRLHEPKPKGKPQTTKSSTNTNPTTKEPRRHKRATINDDSEDDISKDSASRAKKKKDGKHCCTEPVLQSESEMKVIDKDIKHLEKEVEDVEDGVGEQELPNEQDISTSHIS